MGHKRFYRHDQRQVDGAQVDTHTAYLGGLEKIYRTKDNTDTDLIEYKVRGQGSGVKCRFPQSTLFCSLITDHSTPSIRVR